MPSRSQRRASCPGRWQRWGRGLQARAKSSPFGLMPVGLLRSTLRSDGARGRRSRVWPELSDLPSLARAARLGYAP
eukprot:5340997-Prymnesium_polylepis.1